MLSKKYAKADKDRCVACGACLMECPKGAISILCGCYAMIKEEICAGCGKCEKVCPAGCILVKERADR